MSELGEWCRRATLLGEPLLGYLRVEGDQGGDVGVSSAERRRVGDEGVVAQQGLDMGRINPGATPRDDGVRLVLDTANVSPGIVWPVSLGCFWSERDQTPHWCDPHHEVSA